MITIVRKNLNPTSASCFFFLDSQRENLMSNLWGTPTVIDALLNITSMLVPVVETVCSCMSPVGCHKRAKAVLNQLHTADKKFEYVDKLMVCEDFKIFWNVQNFEPKN